jgi:hypothetical protein
MRKQLVAGEPGGRAAGVGGDVHGGQRALARVSVFPRRSAASGFFGAFDRHENLAPAVAAGGSPRRWSDDDVLVYLQSAGEDLPGNLVLVRTPCAAPCGCGGSIGGPGDQGGGAGSVLSGPSGGSLPKSPRFFGGRRAAEVSHHIAHRCRRIPAGDGEVHRAAGSGNRTPLGGFVSL